MSSIMKLYNYWSCTNIKCKTFYSINMFLNDLEKDLSFMLFQVAHFQIPFVVLSILRI